MTPGPTVLPPEVVAAGARPILYSRSVRVHRDLEDVVERLRGVFQTEGEVLVFGASGTGAMDSAVANLARPGRARAGGLVRPLRQPLGGRSAPTTA